MEKMLLIKDLNKLPLEIKTNKALINPEKVWQAYELIDGSGNWYLPAAAKEDLIKNNINFEEVEIDIESIIKQQEKE